MTQRTRFALVVTALAASACAHRTEIPAPSMPLVATPAAVLPGPPDRFGVGIAPQLAFVQSELANGAQSILAHRSNGGYASIDVAVRNAPTREEGIAATTSIMLIRALEMGGPPRLEDGRALDVQTSINSDGVRIEFRVRSEEIAAALGAVSAWMRERALDADDLETIRRRLEEEARAEATSLDGRMERALGDLLYASGDPRRSAPDTERAGFRRVSLAILEERRREVLDPARLNVVVAGEFDLDVTRAAIESAFGTWEGVDVPERRLDPPAYRDAGTRAAGIDRPLMRSFVTLRERAPSRGDEDFAEFLVLEQLLGGMFTSRTNLSVRETSGASYGASADYRAFCTYGTISVTTAVLPEVSRSAIAFLVDEERRMAGGDVGIADNEFGRAKIRAYEQFAYAMDDSSTLAALLQAMTSCGLPPRRVMAVLEEIDGLTVEDVEAAARRWLRPERSAFVIIGNDWEIRQASAYFGRGAMASDPLRSVDRR